jgi:hypothetical protein
VTPELHTGIASTPTGFKAWVVGLSPYTPEVGHWDDSYTFATRTKAIAWATTVVQTVQNKANDIGVRIKVRRWIDGAEQP